MLESNSSHTLYLFTASGQAATIPVHQLPQAEDLSNGTAFSSLVPLGSKEEIVTALSLPPSLEDGFLFLVATDGDVKRIRMEDLPGVSANAFKVFNVAKGAKLGWVFHVQDEDQIILLTVQGQGIRFGINNVRPTGLPSGGMRGVKLLGQKDAVIGAALADDKQYVWTVTDNGVAKYTPVSDYPTQGRAGSGVIAMKLPSDALGLAAGLVGRKDDNIVVVTTKNKAKYMRVSLAPLGGRNTKGDYVISLRNGESVRNVVAYTPRLAAPAKQD